MAEKPENLRMLVIDDDELVRSFIASLCEDNNWSIDQAENGPQGIEMVRNDSRDYEVVLMDIRMPG
ncbi:MAG: response regulator, partial [Candidatus Glassbacteria bacterium]|nr:response regulator [Candidatus Glassbacteria bacterium]